MHFPEVWQLRQGFLRGQEEGKEKEKALEVGENVKDGPLPRQRCPE